MRKQLGKMKSCEWTNDNEKSTRKNIDYLSLVQSADSCLSAPAHPPPHCTLAQGNYCRKIKK